MFCIFVSDSFYIVLYCVLYMGCWEWTAIVYNYDRRINDKLILFVHLFRITIELRGNGRFWVVELIKIIVPYLWLRCQVPCLHWWLQTNPHKDQSEYPFGLWFAIKLTIYSRQQSSRKISWSLRNSRRNWNRTRLWKCLDSWNWDKWVDFVLWSNQFCDVLPSFPYCHSRRIWTTWHPAFYALGH